MNEYNPACLDIIITNVPCRKQKAQREMPLGNSEIRLGSTLIIALLENGLWFMDQLHKA